MAAAWAVAASNHRLEQAAAVAVAMAAAARAAAAREVVRAQWTAQLH